eukprot:NODE_5804_length_486_cov_720.489703_g4352_i0.p1 GENE.NODE_5804_length_486_cov_720.489703_g4352_i0~~NODE_5804_length_486_cov_720.489703_g4352_i0.p1  ORF type:complete len:77 (-),score=20.98 NODE_5804_length_486_cov_720.489703_g4352_i0:182-412(-)
MSKLFLVLILVVLALAAWSDAADVSVGGQMLDGGNCCHCCRIRSRNFLAQKMAEMFPTMMNTLLGTPMGDSPGCGY